MNPKEELDLFQIMDLEGWGDEEELMRPAPPPPGDTAESWEDIAGNTECKEVLRAFVRFALPRRHILIYGPNRSGKTTMIHLALKSKFCQDRGDDLNPCNKCGNCRRWNYGTHNREGSYRNRDGHNFTYVIVDGTNPATYDEDKICFYRDYKCPLIVYIDEASHPDFIKFMPRLIKPMTERPITLVVSGVRLRPRKDPTTGLKLAGLSKDFVYRFAAIKRTTAAAKSDSVVWLRKVAKAFNQDPDDETLSLLLEKAQMIPGQALRPLWEADLLGVPLTRERVENFRWEVG